MGPEKHSAFGGGKMIGTDKLPQLVATPRLVYDLDQLDKNIERMKEIQRAVPNLTVLYALKASYAVLPYFAGKGIVGEVSSLAEALLSNNQLGGKSHAFCVAIKESDWEALAPLVSHISFNSLTQGERFAARAVKSGISSGLRINPRHSVTPDDDYHADYDPTQPGCRFGADINELPQQLPSWVEGLHMHALCENGSVDDFRAVLNAFEKGVGHHFHRLKWLNLGGGQLCTDESFDTGAFIETLNTFSERHPHLSLYLEPGAAWVWNAGTLEAEAVDIVENNGVKTIITDFSFRAHGSDFLVGSAMKTLPLEVEGFTLVEEGARAASSPIKEHLYNFGGASCAMCDTKGVYHSDREIKPGDTLFFRQMGYYFDVTYSWFNGIVPPSTVFKRGDTYQLVTERAADQFIETIGL